MMASQSIQNYSVTSDYLSTFKERLIELINDVSLEPLQQEREYFESKRHELKKDPKYEDQYVAILDNKIIGYGKNGAKLALKMYEEHGYVPILIEKVSEDIEYTTSPLNE